ncbi:MULTISPECIES: hypothetical protein [unclassified Moorena]|uniref:hypothetical protein n=1 Tax=unclassified Moorena TaxID=2683338 RepID=UPI0013FF4C5C|nr:MULTISPECIES: hypothetical protein [unclassified Moorena]NEO15399.1 hypothetical protein [Moorena sp. SIO3E8]NEQ01831.1 hypothetical protein [Moorena sp. SIO3F7]
MAVRGEIKTSQERLEASRREQRGLDQKLVAVRGEIKTLQQQRNTFRTEVQTSQERFVALRGEIRSLEEKINVSQGKLRQLNDKKQVAAENLRVAEIQYCGLQKKLSELELGISGIRGTQQASYKVKRYPLAN